MKLVKFIKTLIDSIVYPLVYLLWWIACHIGRSDAKRR